MSAPFLEKPTGQSVAADVDAILASVAKDVTFCAGGTAEAELSESGAAVFDGSCSIAESQIHGSNVSFCPPKCPVVTSSRPCLGTQHTPQLQHILLFN